MTEGVTLLAGSLRLRPYVYGFLVLYLWAATREWGWRRATRFTLLAGGLAFAAEWTSTRVGVPFGLYHYTGITVGQELFLDNVPLFDPLSFSFLAYAALGTARLCLPAAAGRAALAAAAGLLMMWLDVVIDPLAVRGDRWFLGRIFFYPTPGWYFGVPLANFAGWAVLGAAIAGLWLALPAPSGPTPGVAAGSLPPPVVAAALYYLVLVFNLVVTALVAEPALLAAGVGLHVPLALVVFSKVRLRVRA